MNTEGDLGALDDKAKRIARNLKLIEIATKEQPRGWSLGPPGFVILAMVLVQVDLSWSLSAMAIAALLLWLSDSHMRHRLDAIAKLLDEREYFQSQVAGKA